MTSGAHRPSPLEHPRLMLVGSAASTPEAAALAAALGTTLTAGCDDLVHEVSQHAPDQVIFVTDATSLLEVLLAWGTSPPCPVSWLSNGADVRDLPTLVASGLAGWWPRDAPPDMLRFGLAFDRLRWQREAAVTTDLAATQARLDERKWLDRAKGVLAQARGLGEAEAFKLLRGAAMQSNQKLGDVSRAVTEAAVWADALNRAGQLRMLSQRVVKLAAQRLVGVDAHRARRLEAESVDKARALLAALSLLPEAVTLDAAVRDALAATHDAWVILETALVPRMTLPALAQADVDALVLLAAAESLTQALERASNRRPLNAVNLCGRQRMLAQRIAKDALLADLFEATRHRQALLASIDAFEAAFQELEKTPLSTGDIRQALTAARSEWMRLVAGMHGTHTADGKVLLSRSSEVLLDAFDRLTTLYEHNLQVLMS